MPEPSNPAWRYGVALFPLPPILQLVWLGSLHSFGLMSVNGNGPLAAIAMFLVTLLSYWLSIVLAAIVAVSVFLDATLAGREDWSPNRYVFGIVGLAHLAGAVVASVYLLSVPALVYYLYQRRQSVP